MPEYWYVRRKGATDSDHGQPIGPFDTERDAHLTATALNYLVDWQTWVVSG